MRTQPTEAVVIGGSAGSLEALGEIVSSLPAGFDLPVLVVIHVPPDRDSIIPELIGGRTSLAVREARDTEPILPGAIYFAPPDYHLLVESDRSLSLDYDLPHMFSRPSIDLLFESAADVFGSSLAGVVLSGANADGAAGLRAIAAEGGVAFVQAPETAGSREMPEAAMAACEGAIVSPPVGIAKQLWRLQSNVG